MPRAPTKQELTPLRRISLLFVEDDNDIRSGMRRYLRRYLLSYYEAPNGQEGLEMYRQYQPDIIVTDISMPIMDGLEMARKIKQENENVPIIVTSAHNEMDFFAEAIEIGIDAYTLKPTSMDALLFLILKSAQPMLKQRALESEEKLVHHLLALSSSPTLIVSGSQPERANQAFLDLLGFSSEADLYAQYQQSEDAALTDSAIKEAEQLDCLAQARNHPDVLYRVLRSGNKAVDSFEVATLDMPDIEKCVYTLKPTLN